MKKQKAKKAVNAKKSGIAAKKQKETKPEKQPAKAKSVSKKEPDYPQWTMPEHLTEQDHKDLKRFYELYVQKKFDVAHNFASNFDTIVREEIPADIWKEIGGEINPRKEKEMVEVVAEKKGPEPEKQPYSNRSIDLRHFFIQQNNSLQPMPGNYPGDITKMYESSFFKESDMNDFIIQNSKTLFGEHTVIIDNTASTNIYFPKLFLLDFTLRENPKLYLIEASVSEDKAGLLYARITHFIASLKNKENHQVFLSELCNIINTKEETKAEITQWLFDDQEIPGLLSELLGNKPAILLLKDKENAVLDLIQTVYVETWGKLVRQIMIKKYFCGDDKIYNVNPLFAEIWKPEKSKKEEIIKCTEEDHLNLLPEKIRNIYTEIKSALLETDNSLEFNPKKHYISVRKNKNLAFLHLRRKNLDIVVMNPESDTREQIKHHRIKTLPASVQKFWNGPSCTIVIENSTNLVEVIDLLKKMITKS